MKVIYFGAVRGFSLLEVMVVVALIGILTMVAILSYSEYVVRTNRAEAKDLLSDVAFQQERFNTRNRTYTADMTALGYGADPIISASGFYSVDAAACANATIETCVLVTATPIAGTQQADDGALSLDSRGNRLPVLKWQK